MAGAALAAGALLMAALVHSGYIQIPGRNYPDSAVEAPQTAYEESGPYIEVEEESAASSPENIIITAAEKAETAPPDTPHAAKPALKQPEMITAIVSPAPPVSNGSPPPVAASRKLVAKIAIIIDDIGGSAQAVEGLLAIGEPIAFAILPYLANSEYAARRALESGQVVMLHQPMEPKSKSNNPGPGALLATHDPYTSAMILEQNIQAVPGAMGVNNHMGSYLTGLPQSMAPVMEVIRKRGLFFVDSRTSPETVAFKTARRLGVRSAKRDVFLDNQRDVNKIIAALDQLAEKAMRQGYAVGIGHPYPETIKALKLAAPRLNSRGIRFTPITDLLEGD